MAADNPFRDNMDRAAAAFDHLRVYSMFESQETPDEKPSITMNDMMRQKSASPSVDQNTASAEETAPAPTLNDDFWDELKSTPTGAAAPQKRLELDCVVDIEGRSRRSSRSAVSSGDPFPELELGARTFSNDNTLQQVPAPEELDDNEKCSSSEARDVKEDDLQDSLSTGMGIRNFWFSMNDAAYHRRRSSYAIDFYAEKQEWNGMNFVETLNKPSCNLFEIGEIVDLLKGKVFGWKLSEYMLTYVTPGSTSPIFEITHPTKGRHLLFGVHPGVENGAEFLKYHPLVPIIEDYGVQTIYTPTQSTQQKPGFNEVQSMLTLLNHQMSVESLDVVDEEYSIVSKEFRTQCKKLFDKMLYGKGVWKRIPGVNSVFITHWNTFMRKSRAALDVCYFYGDLKAYILLSALFWSVVLRFKKESRCKNLSKALAVRMTKEMVSRLEDTLTAKKAGLVLVSLNVLFRPSGVCEVLKAKGWEIQQMDGKRITEFRNMRNGYEKITGDDCQNEEERSEINQSVQKAAKHAARVMKWSRNRINTFSK